MRLSEPGGERRTDAVCPGSDAGETSPTRAPPAQGTPWPRFLPPGGGAGAARPGADVRGDRRRPGREQAARGPTRAARGGREGEEAARGILRVTAPTPAPHPHPTGPALTPPGFLVCGPCERAPDT